MLIINLFLTVERKGRYIAGKFPINLGKNKVDR